MTTLVAKKVSADRFDLFRDNNGLSRFCPANHFGRAMMVRRSSGECWYLRSNGGSYDERLDERTIFPSLQAALAQARKDVEDHDDYMAEEARAEQQAEGAWLRHAEMGTWEDFREEERERAREAYGALA